MPLNIDWQQILLHLLNFVILFAGLWLLLYKPVRKFMRERQEHYERKETETQENLEKAEKTRAEYEQKLAQADAEIEAKRVSARKELDGYEAMRRRAAEEEAAAIVASARESAAREQAHEVEKARAQIVGLVAEATKKVAYHSASEAYDAFLDAAGKEDGGDA